MAEMLIHRGNPTEAQPQENAYFNGDIVEIAEDGEYDNKPWLTFIKVKGATVEDLKKYVEDRLEPKNETKTFPKKEYDRLKDVSFENKEINDKSIDVHPLGFTEIQNASPYTIFKPDTKGVLRAIEFVDVTGISLQQANRRRFQIPEDLMQQLFNGVNTITIEVSQLDKVLIENLLDKSYGSIPVKDTEWKKENNGNGIHM